MPTSWKTCFQKQTNHLESAFIPIPGKHRHMSCWSEHPNIPPTSLFHSLAAWGFDSPSDSGSSSWASLLRPRDPWGSTAPASRLTLPLVPQVPRGLSLGPPVGFWKPVKGIEAQQRSMSKSSWDGSKMLGPEAPTSFNENIEQHEEESWSNFGDGLDLSWICLIGFYLNVLEIEIEISMIRHVLPFPGGQRPVWDFCPGSKRSTWHPIVTFAFSNPLESSMWNLLNRSTHLHKTTQISEESRFNFGFFNWAFWYLPQFVSHFTSHLTRASVGFGSVFRFRGLLGGFWRYPKLLELLGGSCIAEWGSCCTVGSSLGASRSPETSITVYPSCISSHTTQRWLHWKVITPYSTTMERPPHSLGLNWLII